MLQKLHSWLAAVFALCTMSFFFIVTLTLLSLDNPFANSHGCSCTLDKGDMIYLASLLDAQPKVYLDELQSELALHCDVDVSLATISATAAAERNELLRATWIAQYRDILQSVLSGLMKLLLMTTQISD